MPRISTALSALILLVLTEASLDPMCAGQKSQGPSVLSTPGNGQTMVRFYYNPPGDAFHFPLIIRVVKIGDPQLASAPVLSEGRTAYITGDEMDQLLQGFDRAGLSWKISEKVEPLGSYMHQSIGDVEIRVVSPKGTAVARLDPKVLCTMLRPLDHAFRTPRALWEFQLFRVQDGCKVPGFDYQAYPDHWVRS